MTYSGTVNGKHIDLDESLPLPDGTRVVVDVTPQAAVGKGSPAAVLRLAGTLTPEEGDAMLEASRMCTTMDKLLYYSMLRLLD